MGWSDLLYTIFGIGERDELSRLTADGFERLREGRQRGPALLYKHSPRCMVCRRAIGEVEEVARSRPDLAVYRIDVLEQRGLSDRVARELDVEHESPQVLLIREGRAVWTASHGDIGREAIDEAIGR